MELCKFEIGVVKSSVPIENSCYTVGPNCINLIKEFNIIFFKSYNAGLTLMISVTLTKERDTSYCLFDPHSRIPSTETKCKCCNVQILDVVTVSCN